MTENRHLSLCMIVKNEEDCIERCLKSVEKVVDEIIIVDTGSTDQTVEICQSYGAKVYPFPWNGSFANARNYGIEKAIGNWILWLDADEEIAAEDRMKLKDQINFPEEFDLLTAHLINYYGDTPDPNNVSQISQVRFFRNHLGMKFQNDIHETLPISNRDRVGTLPVKIYHFGYLNSYVDGKGKSKRNIELLKKQVELSPDGWMCFYLSMEYYRIKELTDAFNYVNESIRLFLGQKSLPPSMVYKLKYAILIDLQCWDEALEGIKRVVLLYPDYVDLWYYMGFILYNKEMYSDAVKSFEKCIEIGEGNLNYYSVKGVGSFLAWYYKGLCLKNSGRKDEALSCFQQVLTIYESYPPALEAISELTGEGQI